MLHTPKPLNHITFVVIFNKISNTVEKNTRITSPFSPSELAIDPKIKQNTTKPNVFGLLR